LADSLLRCVLALGGCGQFIADDLIAELNALVAHKHRRAGNQLLDLMLAFAAKRAIQSFFAGRAFFFGHGQTMPLFGTMLPNDTQIKTVPASTSTANRHRKNNCTLTVTIQGRFEMTWSITP
jgi:hypothetical protein